MKKTLLSFISVVAFATAQADDLFWALRTQSGAVVPLTEVSYVLSSSGATSFSIVRTKGESLTGVTSAVFIKTNATGIAATTFSQGEKATVQWVGNDLVLSRTQKGLPIRLLTTDGRTVLESVSKEGTTQLSIAHLPSQTYILCVGNTSVKLLKR